MAMTRRQIREHVFKLLFDLDFYDPADFGQQIELYFQQLPEEETDLSLMMAEEEDISDIRGKAVAVVEKIPQIDEEIGKVAKGWKTSRMAKADLVLLRLAVYEIQYDENVPAGVAINEAVELAKTYGSDATPAFINGILANFAR